MLRKLLDHRCSVVEEVAQRPSRDVVTRGWYAPGSGRGLRGLATLAAQAPRPPSGSHAAGWGPTPDAGDSLSSRRVGKMDR